MSSIDVHGTHEAEGHPIPHGWRRWLLATNHKDIGTLYLIFSFTISAELRQIGRAHV